MKIQQKSLLLLSLLSGFCAPLYAASLVPDATDDSAPALVDDSAPALDDGSAPALDDETAPALDDQSAPALVDESAPALEVTTPPVVTAPSATAAAPTEEAPALEEEEAPALVEEAAPALEVVAPPVVPAPSVPIVAPSEEAPALEEEAPALVEEVPAVVAPSVPVAAPVPEEAEAATEEAAATAEEQAAAQAEAQATAALGQVAPEEVAPAAVPPVPVEAPAAEEAPAPEEAEAAAEEAAATAEEAAAAAAEAQAAVPTPEVPTPPAGVPTADEAAWDQQAASDATAADQAAAQIGDTGDLAGAPGTVSADDVSSEIANLPDDLTADLSSGPGDYATMMELPLLGKIGFKATDDGMVAQLADTTRKITIGPLTLDHAKLKLNSDETLGLTARGTFLGKKVRVGIKKYDRETKELTLGITFIAKPTVSFIPGVIARLDEVDIALHKGKPTIFNTFVSFQGKQFEFDFTKVAKDTINLAATLPTLTLGELISPAKDTPFGDVALTNVQLEAFGLGKALTTTYSLKGTANLSGVVGDSVQGDTSAVAIIVEINKKEGRSFTAALTNVKLPDVGQIQEAQIVADFPVKKPSSITFSGTTTISIPDVGDLTIKLATDFTAAKKNAKTGAKKGGSTIVFTGDVTQPLSIADGQVVIKSLHAAYTPKTKTDPEKWEFTGDATVLGVDGTIHITRTLKGTDIDIALSQKTFKPFSGIKALDIPAVPGFDDVALANPQITIVGKELKLSGDVTLLGETIHAEMEIISAKKGKVVKVTGALPKIPDELAGPASELGLTNFGVVIVNRNYKTKKVSYKKGITIEADAKSMTVAGVSIKNLHALYRPEADTFELAGDASVFGLAAQANLTKDKKGITGDLNASFDKLSLTDLVDKLGPVKKIFEPVEKLMTLELDQATIAINLPGLSDKKSGISVDAQGMAVGGLVGGILNKLDLANGLKPHISIPLDPADVKDLEIQFTKDVDVSPFPGGLLKLSSLNFDLKGGVPEPQVVFALNGSLKLPKSDPRDLTLSVDTGSVPGTFSFEGGIKGAAINKPLGFPIELDHPYVKVNFAEGELSGFGLEGDFTEGKLKINIFADINVGDPLKSALNITTPEICLTDMFTFYGIVASKATGINLELPQSLICLKNVTGKWAIMPVTTPSGQNIMPGAVLKGELDFVIPGLFSVKGGSMNVTIDPMTPIMTLDGQLGTVLHIGPLVQISAIDDPTKPPYIHGELSPSKQELRVNGLVKIAKIIDSRGDLALSPVGIAFSEKTKLYGVDAIVSVKLSFKHIDDAVFGYEIDVIDIHDFVTGPIVDGINGVKGGMSKLVDTAKGKLHDAEDKCGNIAVVSDICKVPMELAEESVKGLGKTVDLATQAMSGLAAGVIGKATDQFELKSLSIQGDIKGLVEGGPAVTVAVAVRVLGKDRQFSFDIPMPSAGDDKKFFTLVGNAIFDKAIKPAIMPLADEAQRAYDSTVGAINAIQAGALAAVKAIEDAGKEVAKIGTTGYNAVKDAGQTAVKNVTKTANQIADGAKQAANKVAAGATTAVNAIGNSAKTAINAIGGAAGTAAHWTQDAANQVANVAKDATSTISKGATQAADAFKNVTEQAANTVKDFATDAVNKVGDGLKDAANYVADKINPSNW